MKRVLISVLLAMLASVTQPSVAASEGGVRYTIAITQFENRSGWRGYWDLGDAWATVMTDMLQQTGEFIVLGEPLMREEALVEQDFGASGRTAQGSRTPEVGQMTPAQLLVKGAITHVEHRSAGTGGGVRYKGVRVGGSRESAEINATIYVVDSTTGQVLASSSVVGESNRTGATFGYSGANWGGDLDAFRSDNVGKAVEAAVSDAVDWIVLQLPEIPWTGTVARVQNGRIWVNRGEREGVSPGQELIVGVRDAIRDPETGELLYESLSEIARLRVEKVEDKVSICSVTSGEAAKVEEGMRIVLP